jgi:hypothetical protein
MITQLPIIHLNGTSANALLEDHVTALASVRQAREDICGIEFHSRDYYPKAGAWEIARQERTEMLQKIDEVYKDLEKIAIHISQFKKE